MAPSARWGHTAALVGSTVYIFGQCLHPNILALTAQSAASPHSSRLHRLIIAVANCDSPGGANGRAFRMHHSTSASEVESQFNDLYAFNSGKLTFKLKAKLC